MIAVRLRAKKEIDRVFKQGAYHRLGMLHAKSLHTSLPASRVMISVRKSVGSAPQRNRVKRVVREALRLNWERLEITHDICLFITHRPKQLVRLSIIEKEIQNLFTTLNQTVGEDVQSQSGD